MKKTGILSLTMVILGFTLYYAIQTLANSATAPDRDIWGISISFYPKYESKQEKTVILNTLWVKATKLDSVGDTLGTLTTTMNHIIRDAVIGESTELLREFYASPKSDRTHRGFIDRHCNDDESSMECRRRLILNFPPGWLRDREDKLIYIDLEQLEKDVASDYHSKLREYEFGKELFWRYFLYQNSLQTEAGKNKLHLLVSGVIDIREVESEFSKHKIYLESHAESFAQRIRANAVLKIKFCNARQSILRSLQGKYSGYSNDAKSVVERQFRVNIHVPHGECKIKAIEVAHPEYIMDPFIEITHSEWSGKEPLAAFIKSTLDYIFLEK